jgi:hypothetical protein
VLRLTLLTSAVASATFVATLSYAPAVIELGQRLGFGRAEIARETPPPQAAERIRECGPLAKIVAALRHTNECQ